MAREGKGSSSDGKHYWLTPPALMKQLQDEFSFDFDACPYPRPEGYDSLLVDWGRSTYVNPPFAGPTAWVRKSITEAKKGKRVVLVFPIYKWVLELLTSPVLKDVRNLRDVKWCAIEDGSPGRGIGQHIACFVLEAQSKEILPMKNIGDWCRPIRPELLKLGTLTKERAQYVLSRRGKFGNLPYAFKHEFVGEHMSTRPDGITEVEDAYIKMVWSLMSDDKSYFNAVELIAGG